MTFSIGIVAHERRTEQANHLAATVNADKTFWDDGTLKCEGNHLQAWQWMAEQDAEWGVVLEDDAIPCDDLRNQLDQALAVAPAPIVSLYLGTGLPAHWQPRIQAALRYNPQAHWLNGPVISAVGIAIRTELLPLKLQPNTMIDQAISNWAKLNHHPVAHTVPSLVDHRDDEPIQKVRINHEIRTNDIPRKAWQFGTRQRWTSRSAAL
jgi:hypothetical protein